MAADFAARESESSGALSASVVHRWVERTCAAQGVPIKITDRAGIAALVALFGTRAHGRTGIDSVVA